MHGDSDDYIIDGIEQPPAGASLEERVRNTEDNIETLQMNQHRTYSLQREHQAEIKRLLYRCMGVLITLITSILGMVGSMVVL